ncbi:MAG: ATP-binding protein [Polyangiaceae bacterium]
MKLVDYLVLPKEITEFERRYLERVNKIALVFFALHVPLFTAIAWYNDTRPLLAFALTSGVLLGPALARRELKNPRTVSVVFGVTAMTMGGLLVNFGRGPMTIEMHFYFFVLLALLSVFANPMPIVAAAVTVALHHAVLWATFPEAVFNYDAPFLAVALHASFVVMESIAACFVARSFFDNVIGLDRIVRARTAALDARNHEMRLILDNVGQGLLTVDRSALVPSQRSAILSSWFGEPASGDTLHHWLSKADPDVGAWLEVSWEAIFDGLMPAEVVLDQLPKRMLVGGKHYEIEYRPIGAESNPDKLLVVISDVTERVERSEAEIAQREILAAFERLLADRAGFLYFLDEAGRLVSEVRDASLSSADRLRSLHTLKGNLGIYGITGFAADCHALESAAADGIDALDGEAGAVIERRWEAFVASLSSILGSERGDQLQIARSEFDALRASLRDGSLDNGQLLRRLDRWLREPVEARLQHLAEQAQGLARRLGKGEVNVVVNAANVRVPGKRWAALWSSMVHVIRNSVDHGFHSSEQHGDTRSKPRLELSAKEGSGTIEITVRDNGRGIDWDAVRRRALDLGIPATTPRELELALFADGLSTAAQTTDVSGRGVGMAAVLRECQALGGKISVESQIGAGTTLRFVIPDRPTLSPQAA